MAITKTGILIDTTPYFTNPLTFEESGAVSRIRTTGLEESTHYYAKAYVVSDNITTYSVNTEDFYTLSNYFAFVNTASGQNTITLTKVGSPTNISLEYSTDTYNWTSWSSSSGNLSVTINEGETLYLRGNNNSFSTSATDKYKFDSSDTVDVAGNIMTLLDKTGNSRTLYNYCFSGLFSSMQNLINAKDLLLPATTMKSFAYNALFAYCRNLLTPPRLPAKTMATCCYSGLFAWCTSLLYAPELPAKTMATQCYLDMFIYTPITVPPELPATTLAPSCYATMFDSSKITKMPKLPATNLATECYWGMMANCLDLKDVEELPATYVPEKAYFRMFSNDWALTESPVIKATSFGTQALEKMFRSCRNLEKVTIYANTWNTANSQDWMGDNVPNVGDFYNLGGATIPTGDDGIKQGWTEHTSL